jgi:hypothetical protein
MFHCNYAIYLRLAEAHGGAYAMFGLWTLVSGQGFHLQNNQSLALRKLWEIPGSTDRDGVPLGSLISHLDEAT